MSNVCIIRHQGYIKSKMQFPYRHNMRKQQCYSNQNIQKNKSAYNTIIENNLIGNETFLQAFNRLYNNGVFTGQLKIQGSVDKQTKFLDEFLIYPPYEFIQGMSIEKQNEFFKKELEALRSYFPHMIILSAVVHRDEVFKPIDEEMKALFPEGKITPHMHVTAIPIVHDKKTNRLKLSISELWKGKNSYRKFQDHMYNTVGKEYGFERGEIQDFGEAKKHLKVEEFKLQESIKYLQKVEQEILLKEEELKEKAKFFEPEENISIRNVRKVISEQKTLHYALKQEKEKNILIEKEKNQLESELKSKDNIIFNQQNEIENQKKLLSETKKELLYERELNDSILNIKISDERLRIEMLNKAKVKLKLFDLLIQTISQYLPILKVHCKDFIDELNRIGIVSNKRNKDSHNREDR